MPAQGLSIGAASICREESTGASIRPFCMQFPFWSMASGSQCFVPVGMLKAASGSFCRNTTTSILAQGDFLTSFRACSADHCAGGLFFQKSSARAAADIAIRMLTTVASVRSGIASSRVKCAHTLLARILMQATISPETSQHRSWAERLDCDTTDSGVKAKHGGAMECRPVMEKSEGQGGLRTINTTR